MLIIYVRKELEMISKIRIMFNRRLNQVLLLLIITVI